MYSYVPEHEYSVTSLLSNVLILFCHEGTKALRIQILFINTISFTTNEHK